MRTTLTFNSNLETLSEYMTRAAEGLRSIRDDVYTSWGCNLKKELTVEEQEEFRNYVYVLAITEMEKTVGKHCLKKHRFGMDEDDFISNFKIVIMKYLENYNDNNHLVEDEKQYQFSTFLKHLSTEAVCLTYADMHGVSRDVEKKFTLVLGTMRMIAAKGNLDMNDITPEMIHAERPSITVKDIKAVIDFTRGKASLSQMEEEDGLEGEIFKGQDDLEISEFDVLDNDVEQIVEKFLSQMRDVEKFFALLEIGCSDKYYAMTATQLSCDELFVRLISADDKLKKHIHRGTVVIKRPNRSTASGVEEAVLTDVYYVNDNVIRYQKSVAKGRWSDLATKIVAEDVSGRSLLLYMKMKWDELIEKYDF